MRSDNGECGVFGVGVERGRRWDEGSLLYPVVEIALGYRVSNRQIRPSASA